MNRMISFSHDAARNAVRWPCFCSLWIALTSALGAAQFGNLVYDDFDTHIVITGYAGSGGVVEIPAQIFGKPVTHIGDWAFFGAPGVTSISLPSSVANIGVSAFANCSSLTQIVVAQENASFSSANGLLYDKTGSLLVSCPAGKSGNVSVAASTTTIESWAFHGCTQVNEIVLPSGLTAIGDGAFFNCSGLISIALPNSVANIGYAAFSGCSSLTSIALPTALRNISNSLLHGCDSLQQFQINAGLLSVEDWAISECGSIALIEIPSSVNQIASFAFYSCETLATARFNGNAPSLGSNVFDGAASGFRVLRRAEATGFTSPTWHGYPIALFGTNAAPVLRSIGNRSISSGSTLNITVIADDADGDSLQYSASSVSP